MKAGAYSEEGDPNLTLTLMAWAQVHLSVMTQIPLVQSLLWTELSWGLSCLRAGHARRRMLLHWHRQCILNTATRPGPALVLMASDMTSILQMNKLRPRDIK